MDFGSLRLIARHVGVETRGQVTFLIVMAMKIIFLVIWS